MLVLIHHSLSRVFVINQDTKGVVQMTTSQRNLEIEERHVEKKSDSSLVASTFIKYAAYIIIFFGALYFLMRYVFPMF
jgi:ATP-dependent Zn protease